MDQQRRCLLGMVNGIPNAIPATPQTIVIHTLAAASQSGEAFLDVVDLWLHNADDTNPGRVNVILTPPGGAPITLTFAVPAMTSVQVFSEEPFGGVRSGLGGATIALSRDVAGGLSTNLSAWGWFVRTGG